MRRSLLLLLASTATVVAAQSPLPPAGPPAGTPPFGPRHALGTLTVEAGLRVELFAHEPQTMSPVAIDVDEEGRVYVVEMPGYPLDTNPTGRVRLLEDTNGDGAIDRSTLFADGLRLPSGVMRWKQGILVTAAPDVLYFEDRDGDGTADVRRVVLTGFAKTNPQHTVNTPVYGLDNWIYLAHEGPAGATIFTQEFGDRGGPLRFGDEPGRAALEPKERTIRFQLAPNRIEALASWTQYGHAFDAYGRYFTLDNANHARHEVLATRYAERNPDLVVDKTMADISDHGNAAQVFPITHNPRFELLSEVGQTTSTCGLTLELSGAWPDRFAGSAFAAEPVHNLVHRDVYEPSGSTFVARRAPARQEFLASTDAWFRPVNLYGAPDGSLLVVDFYRRLIEHPEWTASELHTNAPALYDGQDRGRIYRVVPEGAALDAWPRPGQLRQAPDAELVRLLGHRHAWWRRTAQRLLVDRRSDASVGPLADVVRTRPSAFARLHALWTLAGLGRLDAAAVTAALGDGEAGVRENALQLAERFLAGPSRDAALAGAVVSLDARENEPRVRFQLLATLGGMEGPEAIAAHDRLLTAGIDDDWMQLAGLSASSARAAAVLDRVLAPAVAGALPARASALTGTETPGRTRLLERLGSLVVSRARPGEIQATLTAAARPDASTIWWRAALLRGVAQGLRASVAARPMIRERQAALVTLAESAETPVRRAALDVLRRTGLATDGTASHALLRAVRLAKARTIPADRRADAIVLVRLAGPTPHAAWLESLVVPAEPEVVQRTAVEALGAVRGAAVGRTLLARWPALTPAVRSAAADAMLSDPARARQLVAALAEGTVPSWSLDFWQKRDLVMHDEADIRASSRSLLEEKPEQRRAVVERYAAALSLQGDPARGQQVFSKVCAACHTLDTLGTGDLGPDLATVRHKPVSALLTDILLPNQAIAQRYESYVIERVSGGLESGVVGQQTPTSVTLRQLGREVLIPRRDIKRMTVVPQSAMPPDLDRLVTPAEMADLLTFIARGR